MSHAFLAAPLVSAAEPPQPTMLRRRLSLESLDGARRIPLDGSSGWWRMAGSTGLEMPPFDVVTASTPAVAGSVLQDVRTRERPIFVPIFTESNLTPTLHLDMLDEIRALVDPLTGMFRIVGASVRTEREMTAIYTGGLEGADGRDESGVYWRKFGLTAIACDPWAYDRTDRLVEFAAAGTGAPFLGAGGGVNALWPRALSSSAVIGSGMRVLVTSEVPVYPTLELAGPMASFDGVLTPDLPGQPSWSVSVPGGVPAGSTLRLVTDPRARSIRLDGALAAGMVARGSSLRPFLPGLNTLDVVAPGGTATTRIRLSWREAHRSLW